MEQEPAREDQDCCSCLGLHPLHCFDCPGLHGLCQTSSISFAHVCPEPSIHHAYSLDPECQEAYTHEPGTRNRAKLLVCAKRKSWCSKSVVRQVPVGACSTFPLNSALS